MTPSTSPESLPGPAPNAPAPPSLAPAPPAPSCGQPALTKARQGSSRRRRAGFLGLLATCSLALALRHQAPGSLPPPARLPALTQGTTLAAARASLAPAASQALPPSPTPNTMTALDPVKVPSPQVPRTPRLGPGCIPSTFGMLMNNKVGLHEADYEPLLKAHPRCVLQSKVIASRIWDLPSLDVLDLRSTHVVADVGCGSGALEMRLLAEHRRVKHLYALDTDASTLHFLQFALDGLHLNESRFVEPVLCDGVQYPLAPASLDRVVCFDCPIAGAGYRDVDPQGFFANDQATLTSLRKALKPGGRFFYRISSRIFDPVTVARNFQRAGYLQRSFELKDEQLTLVLAP